MLVLSIFGSLESFISEDLYPYRYVITPLAALAGLAMLTLAVRAGLHLYFWRHRLATAIIGTPLLVISLVLGDYLVSPLWERSYLNEASPVQTVGFGSSSSPTRQDPDSAGQIPAAPAVQPGAAAQSGGAAPVAPREPSAVAPSADSQAASAPNPPAAPAAGVSSPAVSAGATMASATHRGTFRGADDFHFGRGDAVLIKTATGGNVLRFENFSVRNGPDLYVYLSRDEDGKRVEEALNLGRLKATDGAFNYEIPSGIDLRDVRSVVVWCKQFTVLFAHAPLTIN